MALAGQWVLGLLIGAGKERNLFHQILCQIGAPFVWLARWVTPRVVLERHVPLVAACLLLSVWLLATMLKIEHCVRIGVQLCR